MIRRIRCDPIMFRHFYGTVIKFCLTILYRIFTLILFYPHKQYNPILFAMMLYVAEAENGILFNILFIGMFSH